MSGKLRVTVRLYGELNDLARLSRGRDLVLDTERRSAGDLVQALGVPHTQVDLLLVNGESAPFARVVRDGDRLAVYPRFTSVDIATITRVRPPPLSPIRFVADEHLGRLVRYLRLLGFDTEYRRHWSDEEIASVSADERRILLTRDRGLLNRNAVAHGYCVHETDPRRQLVEVVERFELAEVARPFSRCARCNGLLKPASREEVEERVELQIRERYDSFQECGDCGHVYWRGTHHARLLQLFEEALRSDSEPP